MKKRTAIIKTGLLLICLTSIIWTKCLHLVINSLHFMSSFLWVCYHTQMITGHYITDICQISSLKNIFRQQLQRKAQRLHFLTFFIIPVLLSKLHLMSRLLCLWWVTNNMREGSCCIPLEAKAFFTGLQFIFGLISATLWWVNFPDMHRYKS